ncbi:hypothetical protein NKG94_04715 [Micromonospora sp. M12]
MRTEQYHGRLRRSGVRRLSAAFTAGVITIAAVLLAPQPATADTPWLSVSADRYASFAVPAAYVQENLGTVSQVVVEGNFGPSASWAEFGLTRRGDVWSGVLGALEPGCTTTSSRPTTPGPSRTRRTAPPSRPTRS